MLFEASFDRFDAPDIDFIVTYQVNGKLAYPTRGTNNGVSRVHEDDNNPIFESTDSKIVTADDGPHTKPVGMRGADCLLV
jgi:hypothetical protein